MTRITIILIIGVLISSCNHTNSNSSDLIPEIMQPDWTGIEIENLPIEFGQILKFNSDSTGFTAVILDFNEDEGGQWIGVCFINQNRLFGRQIPSGMINISCLDLLDLTYIQSDALNDYEVVDSIAVDRAKIGIGSRSAVKNFEEIKRDFIWGIAKRKKEQTPCDEGITDFNSVRECYFEIGKIIY